MNNDNLKTLSPSEARENGKKGGKSSGKARRERKALKEQLLLLLESGDFQENICLALLDKAQNGDTKAFEVIRDTIGQKPTDKTEIIGQLPPLVVRELKDDTHNGNSDKVPAADTNQAQE